MTIEDHVTLSKWWKDNRFPIIGLDDLPMVKGEPQGIMVYENDVEICAGFLINTTVRNGIMLEYPVANFQVKNRDLRKKALNFLLISLSDISRNMGKKYIFTSLKHPNLKNRFIDVGFEEKSKQTTEMLKAL